MRGPGFRRWVPRRLTSRLTFGFVAIVVLAGLVTSVAVYELIGRSLRAELVRSGEALASATAANLVGPLLEQDESGVRSVLEGLMQAQEDVAYAFAVGPDGQVVHTYEAGFPADLVPLVGTTDGLRRTPLVFDGSRVQHLAVAPVHTLPLEVHVGVDESRIVAAQRSAALFLVALTTVGCAAAALVTVLFTRHSVDPLRRLTDHVRSLGPGRLDQRFLGTGTEETDELARALDTMAEELEAASRHRELTEQGYRELLRAGSAVGEAVALIADDGPEEGRFVYVNERFAAITGREASELVGRNAGTVLSASSLDVVRRSWRRLRSEPAHVETTEITLVARGGTPRALETASAVIDYQGSRVLAWFARDVTERIEREQEVRRQNRELAALHAVASVMTEPLPPDAFLQRALDAAVAALDARAGCVLLTEDATPRLAASHGLYCDPSREGCFASYACGRAALDGESMASEPLALPCHSPGEDGRAEGRGSAAHTTVPLRAGDSILGALSVVPGSQQPVDDEELRLLAAIGQEVAIGLQRARLWEQLREQERLRLELYRSAIRAQEEERQRIARELHDSTGQSLNALVLGLNTASVALESAPEDVVGIVERLRAAASETVHELQSIIYDLRPSLLDDLGLVPAVRWFVAERLGSSEVTVSVEVDDASPRLPSEVETALFRMTQEAVTNIARHAEAEHAEVRMEFEPRHTTLTITDDGIGFQPDQVTRRSEGGTRLGLLGLRERSSLLGGQMMMYSAPGHGTRIVIRVPSERLL